MQVDVGFGDGLAAQPEEVEFPSLLDLPKPVLRAYQMETTIAEKLDAMLSRGIMNSRMKDYFDIWFLGRNFSFDGGCLAASIKETCSKRGHLLTTEIPIGLTEEFWSNPSRRSVWQAFWRKSVRLDPVVGLEEVTSFVARFLLSPLLSAAKGNPFFSAWKPGGPWNGGGL